jgi:osmotically-inducible protein OsmY
MRKTNLLSILVAVIVSISTLTACVPLPLLMGGAFASTVFVATERRTSGAIVEDESIEQKAAQQFRTTFGQRAHINVTSYNRQVLLTGEVPSEADKTTAGQLAGKIENVKNVVNELGVLGNSSLTSRSSDSVVTSRVKAAFIDNKEIFANAFKIVTERGTVFMMGRVSERESSKATEIARVQSGVQRVVRVFEIISEEELKRLLPKPAPAAEQLAPTPVMSGSGMPWNAPATPAPAAPSAPAAAPKAK